jgi:indole-3-glycerol phosphate synthase
LIFPRVTNLSVDRPEAGTVLDQIVAARRKRIAESKARVSLERVRQAAEARYERRDFAAALAGGAGMPRVIAELKRASPSAGVFRQDYRCREIAQGYEAAGAVALSVLTEEQFFLGSLTDLIDARDAAGLPVLRKDFILEPYQVFETVASGADAFLLIVALLADRELVNFIGLANQFQLVPLVEVHTESELDRALAAGARLIGVNNRDLKTLEVNLETSFRLRKRIPANCAAISESGIQTVADLQRLGRAGFDAVLIGERLMKAEDPGKALGALLQGVEAQRETGNRP